MNRLFLLALMFWLVGCQSNRLTGMSLVKDRTNKLGLLNRWDVTTCKVEAQASEKTWVFIWKATKSSCDLSPRDAPDLPAEQQKVLETAFCTLLQTYWVESPFRAASYSDSDILTEGQKTRVRLSEKERFSLILDPSVVSVEVKTRSQGVITGVYSEHNEEWLPVRMELLSESFTLQVNKIEYNFARLNGRPAVDSFWISLGKDHPEQNIRVTLSECLNVN